MIGLSDVVGATKSTIGDLTDIVGHVEKNIKSYDRIKQRFRRKRELSKLKDILVELSNWRQPNIRTLFTIAEEYYRRTDIERDADYTTELNIKNQYERLPANLELQQFLECLLRLRDFIDENKRDIVDVAYVLYEKIEDAVESRIDLIDSLLYDENSQNISSDRLNQLYISYRNLIESLANTKTELQNKIHELDK
jgi:hypothetical protein